MRNGKALPRDQKTKISWQRLETKISGKSTAWFFTATIHQALHEHKMENVLMRNGTALPRDQKTKISWRVWKLKSAASPPPGFSQRLSIRHYMNTKWKIKRSDAQRYSTAARSEN